MKLRFLGTAAAEGWPALFCNCENCKKAKALGGPDIRTRSQSLVNDDLLIDFPADTYMHVLQNGFDLSAIKIFLITHSHSDHLYPMDFGMRGDVFAHSQTVESVRFIGSADVIREFDRAVNGRISANTLAKFEFNSIKNFETIEADGYRITALKADHAPDQEAHIYLIEKDGKTILYGHDTGYFPTETWEFLKTHPIHLDFVTLDCCYCIREHDRGHMGMSACARVRDELYSYGLIDDTE